MLDPITALATATAVFNGLKKAVEIGRDAFFSMLKQELEVLKEEKADA